MHHSRISSLLIDCLSEDFDTAIAFWSDALGMRPRRKPKAGQRYVTLGQIDGPIHVRLQKVEKNPGYHLDIECDNQRAETARLEAAGGRRKYRIQRWWVMEDPAGNAFCVILPESKGFPANANAWSEESAGAQQ